MTQIKRGRPAKEVTIQVTQATETTPVETTETHEVPKKVLAKTVQLGIGVDLLGSALSLQSRKGNELEVTPMGVLATSGKNGRRIIIPWANIRACELL